MSEDLKPWEPGYQMPTPIKQRTKAEIGALGGKKAAARRAAGLPKIPVSDGTQRPGRKRTDPKSAERAARATEENISLVKKDFLDRFVGEYLRDFNSSMAYIRAGGTVDHATTGGPASLRTAYVQTQLQIVMEMIDEEKLVTRAEIIMGIKREANHFGEDGSSAARVRAWDTLAKIKGMHAPQKVETTIIRNVMEVPLVDSTEAWEDAALVSQTNLKLEVRK